MASAQSAIQANHDKVVRYYKDEFPAPDEMVMAIFIKVDEMAAEVILPEYGNKSAIIPYSELTRRRFRAMNKIAKIGQKQPCLVVRVDKDKGFIDVSKSKINNFATKKCELKYLHGLKINNMMKEFYLKHYKHKIFDEKFFEDLCMRTIWQFDDHEKRKGACYEYLKKCVQDPELLKKHCKLNEEEMEGFMQIVLNNLSPKQVKVRAEVEVSFVTGGVNKIINCILSAKESIENPEELKILIQSPPKYIMELSGVGKGEMNEKLELFVKCLDQIVTSQNGSFTFNGIKIIGDEGEKFEADEMDQIGQGSISEEEEEDLESEEDENDENSSNLSSDLD